jgi:hypothetical protein
MKPTQNTRGGSKYGARIAALFLLAGGLLGMFGSAMAVYHSVQQQRDLDRSGMLSTALFAWCIPTGAALWRGKPNGFHWAKLLFALQIPVFSIARVSYEFSTFFSLRLMIGNTTHYLGANLGSSCNLHLLPQSQGFLFGINIAAVLILLYLIRQSRFTPPSAPSLAPFPGATNAMPPTPPTVS